jgi:hypothetical protein
MPTGSGSGTSLHPEEGVRFLLERREIAEEGAAARYLAAVYTPDEAFEYAALLRSGGEVEMTAAGARAPAELEDKLLAHARQLARAAARKAAEELPPWPHRVLRWRGPGRG